MDHKTTVACKVCGYVFETSTDEIGNPVIDVCNDCLLEEADDFLSDQEEGDQL